MPDAKTNRDPKVMSRGVEGEDGGKGVCCGVCLDCYPHFWFAFHYRQNRIQHHAARCDLRIPRTLRIGAAVT